MQNRTVQKRLILETALRQMLTGGYENATIDSVSHISALPPKQIRQHYPTEEELRMAVMEYAASVWLASVAEELEQKSSRHEKLYTLIYRYIAGSESHSDSLSLYVDLWKRIRDMADEAVPWIKVELEKIYTQYACFFQKTLCELFTGVQNEEQLAWIMVVISDGFHIQSLIRDKQPDFDQIAQTLCKMLEHLL